MKHIAMQVALLTALVSLSLVMGSCDKDDNSPGLVNSEILGKWESTTFQVTECDRISENVELRSCDLSEADDVDCGLLEFRSDGKVVEDGQLLEEAANYTLDGEMLYIIDPQANDTMVTFRFEVSVDTLTLYAYDFNGPGCLLASHRIRSN